MNDFQLKSYALLQLNVKSKILGTVSPCSMLLLPLTLMAFTPTLSKKPLGNSFRVWIIGSG